MVLSPSLRRCRADRVEVEVEHFVEHLLVGLVRGGLEEIAVAAPERVHEQHRAQHARGDSGIYGTKLPALDAALDNARDETPDPLDDLAAVKTSEVGKVAELRVDETEERGKFR